MIDNQATSAVLKQVQFVGASPEAGSIGKPMIDEPPYPFLMTPRQHRHRWPLSMRTASEACMRVFVGVQPKRARGS
jgi:hypothetical protein